ncbi:unnamed protein product [Acanthoscelides obtectus]|uniref:L-lactate dehydrogenase n=1 Tax=Acanthoscelides obtectus TaxID=200917 RepID=A0A9P0PG23_ACAOB|nr:unnamed protein product [Acanthoscelides obtectus]CAK1656712.1 L-lactate dehydrogenase [Acanthoscelides obtectus]
MSIPNVHRLIPKFLRVNGLTANSNELSHNYGTYKIYSINEHGPFSEKIGDFEDENYLYMNEKNLVRHKSLNNESQSYAKRYYSTKEGSKPNKLLHIYGRRCYATKPENVKGKLMHEIQKPIETFDDKVTVVGIGAVGMACAFSILSQGISNNLVLIDMFENKLEGEMMDLQHGSLFLKDPKITASTDYAVSAGSRVCVVTAGVRQKDNESRTDLLQRNADLMKNIIPHLVEYSPNAVLLIVSNPCDVLSYVAWKISGFPMTRIIGSGTNLDTSRFRYMIANRLNIAPASVHAWIIGEHGDTSVAVWLVGINEKNVT